MNTDLIRPELKRVHFWDRFACYYMSTDDLVKFYPEVRKCIGGDCPDISRLARGLLNELIYSELSKIDYLDFSDFVNKKRKVSLLSSNGIIAIDDDDDNELLSLLKNLGEEKVLRSLFNNTCIHGKLTFSGEV